ncbi:pentapeptide repeat-containing protein [Ihubacter massiliensis]|uniref:Pentapeptide repeat-containing protein n=1 Tax=Hominibacterium faecale TaxID=2839743 RepID=A0A9J6QYF9_9FIRM|nr:MULTISPECIES: pentapeptide repeat-containing protein [Eubacteriales Family XIII. Incertae Sedis]MCO7120422.1 pentapeptide repeat-containing protein [Ihubacter massiliensis]MCU7380547.1 pentapeptide repeat-containing protein [Hominibacterium faecale]
MDRNIHMENQFEDLRAQLHIDCGKCCGLCCTALYFSKSEGFPSNKKAGKPCPNLLSDFRCKIHSQLSQEGLKGCIAYDCFGAGQKVTQMIYSGSAWKTMPPDRAQEMFDVFIRVYQLHQILWYLIEALSLTAAQKHKNELKGLILKIQTTVGNSPADICSCDIEAYRKRVNHVLKEVGDSVGESVGGNKTGKLDESEYLGRQFGKADLSGQDFSMALMIASDLSGCKLRGTNFLGADLRDTDLSNADLSESIFLTQMQINEAKGNKHTRLPDWLERPDHWK